jgi:hypothetical protein
MKYHTKFSHLFTGLLPILVCIVAIGGLLVGAQPASAQVISGPTQVGHNLCMQTTFSGQTAEPIPSSVRLNCTANDISIAEAISVDPPTCVQGETIPLLTATFLVNVNASNRYDAGFYFNIDGGANARLPGDADNECSLSILDPEGDPGLQLDGDNCGDLNQGTVNVTFEIPGVLCQAAPGTNRLRLPNCTAWHNLASTACTTNAEADPDNKSKCKCDDNFTVPVIVETATLIVTKTAAPTSVPETGGEVTYTVDVKNNAQNVSVTITEITDDIYGNLGTNTPPRTDNTCPGLIGDVLLAQATTSCSFKAVVSGNKGDTITDTAEVCGTQQGSGARICDDDDADVVITDVAATPSLLKTAQSAACTADVTYQVVVSNNSLTPPGDTLTVNALTDNQFGNITTAHAANTSCTGSATPGVCEQVVNTTCSLPQPPIAAGGNFTCTFVGRIIDPDCTFTHADTVTGNVTDSDNVTSTPSDGASVSVTTTVQ